MPVKKPKSGKFSREKGSRVERAMVHLHHTAGIPCERVPLSGACGGAFTGDLKICGNLTGEVKARQNAHGFKQVLDWLGCCQFLFVKMTGVKEPTVIMPWAVYERLMHAHMEQTPHENHHHPEDRGEDT